MLSLLSSFFCLSLSRSLCLLSIPLSIERTFWKTCQQEFAWIGLHKQALKHINAEEEHAADVDWGQRAYPSSAFPLPVIYTASVA